MQSLYFFKWSRSFYSSNLQETYCIIQDLRFPMCLMLLAAHWFIYVGTFPSSQFKEALLISKSYQLFFVILDFAVIIIISNLASSFSRTEGCFSKIIHILVCLRFLSLHEMMQTMNNEGSFLFDNSSRKWWNISRQTFLTTA